MVRTGKKSLLIAAAVMLVWIATPATAQDGVDNLCAGQHNNVGTVTVTNDDEFVYVTYEITVPGAFITETHAHVSTSLAGIPQTKGKNKNPIPGNFSHKADHPPGVTTVTHTFDLPEGSPLYVAAHAVVEYYADGPGEIVDQADPALTFTPGQGGGGDPAPAIRFEDGWVSLGLTGQLVVQYDCPLIEKIGDGVDGWDIQIWERSDEVPPEEKALISVSANGVDWTDLGEAGNFDPLANHGDLGDFRSVFELDGFAGATYLRVLDTTSDGGSANGFDLRAIKSMQSCTPTRVGEDTAWGGACAGGDGDRFTPKGNWGTYLTYVPTLEEDD